MQYRFLAAGHETTSMLLTWTFYILSQHPKIVEKLRKEISEVIGDSNNFSIVELEKLVYTGYVLREVLRMYPPASIVARRTKCDTELGEYSIPKDVCIFFIFPISWFF